MCGVDERGGWVGKGGDDWYTCHDGPTTIPLFILTKPKCRGGNDGGGEAAEAVAPMPGRVGAGGSSNGNGNGNGGGVEM